MFRTFLFSLLIVSSSATAQSDKHPAHATQNPLMPAWNETFDFERIDTNAINTSVMYTENKITQLLSAVGKGGTPTWSNTMAVLDDVYDNALKAASVYELLTSAHPDKAIRDKSGTMLEKFTAVMEDLNLNEPLYNHVKRYAATAEAKALTGERKYFLDKVLRDFDRNGMSLTPANRDTLRLISKRINELSTQFNKNIATDRTQVIMRADEMEGCPEDYKKTYLRDDGTYVLDLSNPTYGPFMANAKNAAARKKLFLAKLNIAAAQNEDLLVQIVALRTRKAKLLGYPTYSAYVTGDIMAKNPKTVWEFENALAKDLRPKAQEDLKKLVALKARETGEANPVIELYDAPYYTNMLLRETYNVDNELVKEYFEMQNVITGIFGIYQKLYNVSFVEDKSPSVWHKEVQAYSVYDNKTKQRIGYFYLDLYPRENKYNHFACFPLTGSKTLPQGVQLRAAALVCNFPRPTGDKPSLLPHSTVSTFLHEFGHLMHVMVSETELAVFAGTNTVTDFVEAPSQIMENWAWQKDVLATFAKHYKTGEVIPGALVDRMIAARNVNSGLLALMQVFYGTFDFALNDGYAAKDAAGITALVKETQNRVTLYPFVEGTHFAASFGHLTGYGSKYYGYLWSSVYAHDMFSVFAKNGAFSATAGDQFRRKVLAKGGSDDAINLVRNFLGREPDNKAFLKHLGL